MNKNFWKELETPILVLAPMAGFTNSSFRKICKKFGADVVYSEMVSTTALYFQQSDKVKATIKLLKFNSKKEYPYVVQLFGSNPKHFAEATQFITRKIRPAGIDINFGCPVNKVIKQGAGAALMQDLENSYQVIKAVIDNTNLPVSVKVRVQSGKVSVLDFIKRISDLPVAAIMIHARSLNDGFSGYLDWERVKEVKKIFSGIVLANGGIIDLSSAKVAIKESGADGLGLARGVLGRPWLFREIKNDKEEQLSFKEISKIILKQAREVYKHKGSVGIIELRKHLCWYVQGLSNAKRLREKLVKVENFKDIKKIIKEYV